MKTAQLTLLFLLSGTLAVLGQSISTPKWKDLFDLAYYGKSGSGQNSLKEKWATLSKDNDALQYENLSYGLDALNAIYQATNNNKYLDDAISLVNNVTSSAIPISSISNNKSPFRDRYSTWVVRDSTKQYAYLSMNETPLSEAYLFQYVCKLLYIIHNTPALNSQVKYRQFYYKTLTFVEKNIWDKWYSRGLRLGGSQGQYLQGRTHIASHWAFMASILFQLSSNEQRKTQYNWAYTTYNKLLKSNFRVNSSLSGTFIWDSTWDNNQSSNRRKIIQDVSHGNLVISYIVNSYDMNLFWGKDDISSLCKLLSDYLWISDKHTFLDNLDGSKELQSSRGTFQSDGWAKLGRYDRKIQNIYTDFYVNNPRDKYANDAQLLANLALNEKILSGKGL